MVNFLLILVCITAGLLLKRSGAVPTDAHKGINAFIIYLALPAVSLKYLPHIQWSRDLLFAALAPVITWLGSWMYVTLYAKRAGLDRASSAGMKLTTGLCNTSFLGFPLVTAYFGESLLGTAVICDQVSFILLSVAGIIVAAGASQNQKLTAGFLLKQVLTFPPFLGCAGGLLLPHLVNLSPLSPLFDKLAGTVGPLALFSIGLQLKFEGWRQELKAVSTSLLYKLLLAPAIIFLIALTVGLRGDVPRISVFEMSMSGMLTTGVVADEYHLNPKLANLIVGIGILGCLITSGLWYFIIIHGLT